MSTTYIAGYDGSPASHAAVRWASRLARGEGATVTAATAYPVPVHIVGKGASDGSEHLLERDAKEAAARVLDGLEDGLADELLPLPGSPAAALADLAEDRNVRMLVVGATHRGGLGRLTHGSVGEQLLHGAACPVLVVPEEAGDGEVRNVAVAYDGSSEAKAALAAGKRLAERHRARLHLLCVVAPPVVAGMWGAAMAYGAQERIKQQLEREFAEVAEREGAELRLITASRAGVALVNACGADADIVVAGSRGFGPRKAVLLGSVSRMLVDHAPCPVLVTPRAWLAETTDHAERATASVA